MKVLVACEESQAVCKAFREKGHEAYSCDIQECSGGHPEWHIQYDVLQILSPHWHQRIDCEGEWFGIKFTTADGEFHWFEGKWDLIIAHPPCTHLSSSGQWAYKKGKDISLKYEGIKFFMEFVNADCDKIAIENPIGIMSTEYQKPSQIIQPWQFGHKAQKSTCLWLKGLPLLTPTNIVEKGEFVEWIDKKTGRKKRQAKYDFDILKTAKTSEERSRLRSKTFEGIALAMSEQWGNIQKGVNQMVFISDNPHRDFDRYDAEQSRLIEKLPKCCECNEPIQADFCYEINGELICEDCLNEFHRKETEDFVNLEE